MTAGLPSIRGRLWRSLLGLALGWGLVVSLMVWLAVQHEVDELLDDTLRQAAAVLTDVIMVRRDALYDGPVLADSAADDDRFAWQVCVPGPRVLLRSAAAPAAPWVPDLGVGYADASEWRVYGVRLDGDRRLYVAQSRGERREALFEVSLSAIAASLLAGLVTVAWLRVRVDRELRPLAALSRRLEHYEPLDAGAALAPPQRVELVAIQDAIGALGRRLARRVESERAFTAHAAHALRTPLAGIDAQLAVALREAPASLQPRLQRVRTAASRLARVVAALLALFRSGTDVQRVPLDLAALVARMPVEGLAVEVEPGARLVADPDLLAAVLLNLLDNSQRHGATRVTMRTGPGNRLALADDGSGATPARRAELRTTLAPPHDDQRRGPDGAAGGEPLGLGLRLAQIVARAHGGGLTLPETQTGFAIEIDLGAADAT